MKPAPQGEAALRLNHAEFACRPGEGPLATALFEALGCGWYEVDATPYGRYIVVRLDETVHGENDLFVSEAEPEQLALEAALADTLQHVDLRAAAAGFRKLAAERPYRATHVGLRLPSVAALDAAVARLEALAAGLLRGRLRLGEPMSRGAEEARATSSPMKQLWIGTDVISTGLLTFGQQFELQAYDP